MCQYFRWTCTACQSSQGIVCSCESGRLYGVCQRKCASLPLPDHAAPTICQCCGNVRQPRAATMSVSSGIERSSYPLTRIHQGSPPSDASVPVQDNDIRVPQSARLPDVAEILARWDRTRRAIFQGVDEEQRLSTNSATSASDQAWLRLINQLCGRPGQHGAGTVGGQDAPL